jgi:5-enolpyruvylshikimate-3-phosphate synthase
MSNVIDFNKKRSDNLKTGETDRIAKIRQSLDRINVLMDELRKMGENTDTIKNR